MQKESGSIVLATLQECDGVFLNLVNKPVFPGDSAAPRRLKRTQRSGSGLPTPDNGFCSIASMSRSIRDATVSEEMRPAKANSVAKSKSWRRSLELNRLGARAKVLRDHLVGFLLTSKSADNVAILTLGLISLAYAWAPFVIAGISA